MFRTAATKSAPSMRATGTSMPTAVTIRSPLDPATMSQAGVPLEEALWYSRIPSGRHKLRALQTERGGRILDKVRGFMVRTTARDAMPLAA